MNYNCFSWQFIEESYTLFELFFLRIVPAVNPVFCKTLMRGLSISLQKLIFVLFWPIWLVLQVLTVILEHKKNFTQAWMSSKVGCWSLTNCLREVRYGIKWVFCRYLKKKLIYPFLITCCKQKNLILASLSTIFLVWYYEFWEIQKSV